MARATDRGVGNSGRRFVSGLAVWLLAVLTAAADDAPQSAALNAKGQPTTLSADDRAALESLFTQWQARRSDIASARVTYRSFHNAVDGGRTAEELENLLDAGLLDQSPGQFREFIAAMNGGPYRIDPPWGPGAITVRDAQRRNDLGSLTSVEDRDICVDFDSLNAQFDASSPGGSRRRPDDLLTFRPLPPEPWTFDHWRIVKRTAEHCTLCRILSAPGVEPPVLDARTYEFDLRSGLVTRIARSTDRGKLLSVARYLLPVELPGAVTFPQVFVEAILRNGVVTVLHVCAIESISVNESIPDSAFALPAPANSRIVDYRGPQKLVSRLREPQADMMAWLKQHAPVSASVAKRPAAVDHSVRNVLLTGNGPLLVVVGLAVWKRQRKATDSRSL